MRPVAIALLTLVLICHAPPAIGQDGRQPLALADPVVVLAPDDPASKGIDLYIDAVRRGLSRGCRDVVGVGRLSAILEPASLGPTLTGSYDRSAVQGVLRHSNAVYLVVVTIRRDGGRYRAVAVALDPDRRVAALRQTAAVADPHRVLGMVRTLAQRIARWAGCPSWRGSITVKRVIEIDQTDDRTKASDTGTETEQVTYEFGGGLPAFNATLEAKSKSVRIRAGATETREVETAGTGKGRVRRTHAYVRVNPDGSYLFVLGSVPIKANWQSYLCREPGACKKAAGKKTAYVAGLRVSGKAAMKGRRFKGTRTIKTVSQITETLVWDLVRSNR